MKKIILIGAPNVGKSVIFNYLTGLYTTVSNYPGTTVEVARGQVKIAGVSYEVVDTPGSYSLVPLSGEELVTRRVLETEKSDVIIHVIDAKNLERMLPMTIQLIEAGMPVLLMLNMMDEAERLGISVNVNRLAEKLGIPVYAVTAICPASLVALKRGIAKYQYFPMYSILLEDELERAIGELTHLLTCKYKFRPRFISMLLLAGDEAAHRWIQGEPEYLRMFKIIQRTEAQYDGYLEINLMTVLVRAVQNILKDIVCQGIPANLPVLDRLDRWTRHPIIGYLVLCLVIYFGLYQVVGKFGAGFMVDYLDKTIFKAIIMPFTEMVVYSYIPWTWAQSMLVGEYGIISLGFRYALAIVLPIISIYFLVFSLLEDCGYLPRIALLTDWLFKYLGLNGRAVIPITLGFGCGTLATVTARTLETKREQVLATFLIALAIPCSAQLGVVMALLAHNLTTLLIWSVVILMVFVSAGWLSAKVYPGTSGAFYFEIPPLRLPIAANILAKAYSRIASYFVEIVPIFIIASCFVWALDFLGIVEALLRLAEPLMAVLGLPQSAARAFMLGFFRRDYGAAGLYDLSADGLLSDQQLVVTAVIMTLFLPCIAQVAVMVKERGGCTAALMLPIIIGTAMLIGWLVHVLLASMQLFTEN